jgi:hypothetical protein
VDFTKFFEKRKKTPEKKKKKKASLPHPFFNKIGPRT